MDIQSDKSSILRHDRLLSYVALRYVLNSQRNLRHCESSRSFHCDYQLVLDAQALAVTRARVGVESLASIGTAVREFFRSSPLRARNAAGVESTMDTFFVHSLSHYVGRQVHGEDTGWNPSQPIQAGQVFVFEPGLYIASEGIGIRIEDTFLATPAGLECLSCASPKSPSELERRP
jgi:Xaa-Pro aminopeptidase